MIRAFTPVSFLHEYQQQKTFFFEKRTTKKRKPLLSRRRRVFNAGETKGGKE
jgi:hypothetical protein